LLKEIYYNVNENEKISFLIHLLNKLKPRLGLIFCNTKHMTRFVADVLKQNGFKAECMNGDMTQAAREQALKDFALEKIKLLIATDVAARGIHVEDITHVINYDLPSEPDVYTHRIGRTARNGSTGTAIVLLSDRDYRNMDRVMKLHKHIKREDPGEFPRIRIQMRREPRQGGYSRGGGRPSGGSRRPSGGRINFNRRR
jgi:superfamily II DNA/RNA helicase